MSNKVYILSDEMRASKSGFYIEGTDIEMDYPDAYPLPMETEVLEETGPIALRVLPNCPYLEKELQIKNGYPAVYKYTDNDRKKLTFTHARLELDEKRDKLYIEYIERSAWKKGNEGKKTRQTTRTICQEYNEEILINAEIEAEEMIHIAKTKVFALSEAETKDLYRLSVGGNFVESNVSPKQMKRHLLSIAEHNPEFITAGIKTTRDKINVLLNKAVEYKIVSFITPGKVTLYVEASNEWVPLLDISEAQGPQAKIDKFVEYLMTDMGQAELSIIENRVKEREGVDDEPEEKQPMFVHDEDKTTSRKKNK
jgi:hypothetical protein